MSYDSDLLSAWDRLCDEQERAEIYEEEKELIAVGMISPGTCERHRSVFVPIAGCEGCQRDADEAEYRHWLEMERWEKENA